MNEKRLWKLFLLPSLGGVLVFYLLPFVLSLYYGMIDNMGSRQFVGLQNVVETLKNPMFLQAAGNTAVYLGLSIPLILLFSLGLALLLHRGNRTLFVCVTGAAGAAIRSNRFFLECDFQCRRFD